MVLLGGLAVFLYGMGLGGEYLQRTAGRRLRQVLARLTGNRVLGVGVGTLVTLITNSSSATSVILVGFAGAGLITVAQAIPVVMGASIGTAFTVQLIAFNLSDHALWMVAGGFVLSSLKGRAALAAAGHLAMAFGFIFLGMGLMRDAVAPLRDDAGFLDVLRQFQERPWLAALVGLVFTAIIQASGASVGLLIALAGHGDLSLQASIAYVLGANVGTCITAILASLGSPREGKQIALAQLAFKLVGSLAAMACLGWLAAATQAATLGVTRLDLALADARATPRAIANAHLLFNLANTILFLPAIGPLARLVAWAVPTRPEQEAYFRPRFLDERVLDTPEVAIANAHRETLRMAEVVELMLRDAIDVFTHTDEALRDRVRRRDDRVDLLQVEVTRYLTLVSRRSLGAEPSERVVTLLNVVHDLEGIGDVVVKNLMENAAKKAQLRLEFSPEGLEELVRFHARVLANFRAVVGLLERDDDPETRRELAPRRLDLLLEEDRLRRKHIERLAGGLQASLDTSAIHLDVLGNLLRINLHVLNIARHVLGPRQDEDVLE